MLGESSETDLYPQSFFYPFVLRQGLPKLPRQSLKLAVFWHQLPEQLGLQAGFKLDIELARWSAGEKLLPHKLDNLSSMDGNQIKVGENNS